MPRLTLQYGGSFLEPIEGALFFPPLFERLAQEPTVDRNLLKGCAVKVEDFVVGQNPIAPGDVQIAVAHLELALLDDRRSPLVLDELSDRLQVYLREYFARTLANRVQGCYLTSDVRLIPARWHRSVSRRAPSPIARSNSSASHRRAQGASSTRGVCTSQRARIVRGIGRGANRLAPSLQLMTCGPMRCRV